MNHALLEGVIFQIENTVSIIHSIESTVANDSVNSRELLYALSVAVQFVLPLHCILGLLANIADPSYEEITNQKGIDTSVCNLYSEISPCKMNYFCLHWIILLRS